MNSLFLYGTFKGCARKCAKQLCAQIEAARGGRCAVQDAGRVGALDLNVDTISTFARLWTA